MRGDIREEERECGAKRRDVPSRKKAARSAHSSPSKGVNGRPTSRFSHRTSAVKDSVYPLEPFPTVAQIKNQSVIYV